MTGLDQANLLAFAEARRVNERWITAFAVAASLIFGGAGIVRIATGDPLAGTSFAVLSLGVGLYYAVGWWRARLCPPSALEAALRTSLEAGLGTALLLALSPGHPDAALQNAPVLLYVIAIFAAVLRLYPQLSLLAGTLAAGGWLICWAALVTKEGLTLPGIGPEEAVERAILLGLCGVLSHQIGQTLVGLTGRIAQEATHRERIRRAFGAYVAEPIVQRVLQGDLSLSTERRVISVLFVDIRGFTTFSAEREPAEVLGLLNSALEAFSIEVQNHGGIVNKFLGDGLMALFGAPVEEVNHARHAALAALAIAKAARRLDRQGAYPGLRVGVGLHCGEVVVGDVGGEDHREYTAIGDVVNVASRVESATKELGETVLVTEEVLAALGEGFTVGPASRIRLRGRMDETSLFALRGGPSIASKVTVIPTLG